MWVLSENSSEERRAGGKDQFVGLDLSGATAESAVEEIFLLPNLPESHADVTFKIIPPQAEFLTRHHPTWW